MTREEAEQIVGCIPPEWAFVPVRRSAFFIVYGPEIHCWRADDAKGHWITRQDIENITKPLFKRYGHCTTKVRRGNTEGQAFVSRLGFKPIRVTDHFIEYIAESMNHARL